MDTFLKMSLRYTRFILWHNKQKIQSWDYFPQVLSRFPEYLTSDLRNFDLYE
jgi:hypothetical protein